MTRQQKYYVFVSKNAWRKISLSRNSVPNFIFPCLFYAHATILCSKHQSRKSLNSIARRTLAFLWRVWLQGTKACSPHQVCAVASWLVSSSPECEWIIRSARASGSSPARGRCVVFLDKTLYSESLTLRQNKILSQTYRRLRRLGWEPP